MSASSQIRLGLSCCLLFLFSPLVESSASTPLEKAAQVATVDDQPLHLSLSPAIGAGAAIPSKFNLEVAEFAAAPEYFPALPHKTNAKPEPAPDDLAQHSGYQWRSMPPEQPDLSGAMRDAAYFVGYQFIGVAILYVAPESISGWTDESKEDYSFQKWRDNVSNPVWDKDKWYVNYLAHPYWGGAYYIQARERGLDKTQSFLYSVLLSTLWEYGVEAVAEPVSKQDLIVTPLLGYLVGEYLFAPWRQYIRDQAGEIGWSDKIVLALTDPLGVLSVQTDKILGVKTRVRLTQGTPATTTSAPPTSSSNTDLAYASGLPRATLGIELRMDW